MRKGVGRGSRRLVGRIDVPVPLRRAGDAVRPVQAGVEPLRRVGRADLTGQHRAHLVVVNLRVAFGIEVAVLPAVVRPAPGHAVEDLTGIALGPELLVAGQFLEPAAVGNRALQPVRHALLGDSRGAPRNAGLATVLLRKHVDGDLTPGGRNHNVLRLEDHRPVGVDDARGPRLENHARIGISGGGIGARKLHANSSVIANTRSSFMAAL